MNPQEKDSNKPIGKLIILKQYFHPHYGVEPNPPKLPDWLVLGHYDSVETHIIKRLKDLIKYTRVVTFKSKNGSNKSKDGPNAQTYIPLVLNSFYMGKPTPANIIAQDREKEIAFRFFIQMQLSAVTVDGLKRVPSNPKKNCKDEIHFKQLVKGVDQIGGCIQSILDDPAYTSLNPILYRSMGADEFIAELTFAHESELSCVYSLFQALKGIDFQRAIPHAMENKNHHVFGRVHALVTFNRKRVRKQREIKNPPSSYKIVQHIRISPGHDHEALQLTTAKSYPKWIGTGTKNMVVEFQGGFEDYVSVIKDRLTEFNQNTGSVYSEFLFNPSAVVGDALDPISYANPHGQIAVGKYLLELIDETQLKLEYLEKTMSFGYVQIAEFKVLLHIAIQGLLRNDKQVFLLDLIPYIRSIPDYLIGYHKLVEGGSLTSKERLRYLRAIDRFVAYLRRSVRNRLEEMSNSGDPMSLSNRSLVSPKLMAAYSICARVVWSFLKDSFQDQAECNACALVGTLGRVIVEEPLLGLRQKITDFQTNAPRRNTKQNVVDSKRTQATPLPRLLFYDLSGPLLLRPEAVFLSTVHELAEHLEWKGPRSEIDFRESYRDVISQASLEQAAVHFIQERQDFIENREYQRVLGLFIFKCLEQSTQSDLEKTNIFFSIDFMHDLLSSVKLDTFFDFISSDTKRPEKIRLSREQITEFLSDFKTFVAQSGSSSVQVLENRATSKTSFPRSLGSLKDIVNECFADAAMFYFLRAARKGMEKNKKGSEDVSVNHSDWFYIYYYVLEAHLFWAPDLYEELSALTPAKLRSGFSNARLSEFFHRAVVLHYLVHRSMSKNFDVRQWESMCQDDIYGLYARFCMDHLEMKLKTLDQSVFSEYQKIQFHWLRRLLIIPENQDESSFASLLWEQFDQDRNSPEKECFSSSPYTRELASQFIGLWDACAEDLCGGSPSQEKTINTERERVRFLEALWCESTFVDVNGIFQ
jgi:hypothetical protein